MSWIISGSLYILNDVGKNYTKLAMFDLDHTLIKPKLNIHPKNVDDWKWVYTNIPKKLKELSDNGYLICIISNQSHISDKPFLLDRIIKVLNYLDPQKVMDINVYIATDNDKYRKPSTSIFENYIFRNHTEIFYVGDAAGRKKDFSDSDRKFAHNIDLYLKSIKSTTEITFYTPEEYFKNTPKQAYTYSGFDPLLFLNNIETNPDFNIDITKQNVFILIGPPASGKSTFSKIIMKFWELCPGKIVYISQDIMPKAKCKKIFINSIYNGSSIILDNTNPSDEAREFYTSNIVGNVIVYYIEMSTYNNDKKNRELYEHLNIYRQRVINARNMPNVVYNMYYKKYDTSKITTAKIKFVPDFKNEWEFLRFMQLS